MREFGDATLRKIARELTEKLRASNSVDWYVRESVRAKLRLMVKTILKKYKYPRMGRNGDRDCSGAGKRAIGPMGSSVGAFEPRNQLLEDRDPPQGLTFNSTLPIALISGLFIVGVLFMATNAAIQYTPAGLRKLRDSERPAVAGSHRRRRTPAGAGFVAVAMALSIFVTLNGTVMSGARIPYAAARDRLFFRQFAQIQPSLPVAIHVARGTGVALHRSAALPQPVSAVFELAVFAEWLFYMLTAPRYWCSAALVLERSVPIKSGVIRCCLPSLSLAPEWCWSLAMLVHYLVLVSSCLGCRCCGLCADLS